MYLYEVKFVEDRPIEKDGKTTRQEIDVYEYFAAESFEDVYETVQKQLAPVADIRELIAIARSVPILGVIPRKGTD